MNRKKVYFTSLPPLPNVLTFEEARLDQVLKRYDDIDILNLPQGFINCRQGSIPESRKHPVE